MRQCATCLRPMGVAETCMKCGWVDPAMEERRIHRLAQERAEAARLVAGRTTVRRSGSLYEDEYAAFRMALVVASFGKGLRQRAAIHAEQLAAWLDDPDHAAWVRDTVQGQCGHHEGPHTLLRCLTDELAYWMTQSVSKQIQTNTMGVGMTIGDLPDHPFIPRADLFTGSQDPP